jgi:hypothetical protein
MHEIIINLHMHTPFSDGFGSHQEIAKAAMKAELDAVIVTDHNVLIKGVEKIYSEDNRKVLLLVGEEIHNQARVPQKNHLLVIGADRELSGLASDINKLLDGVRQAKGLSFIAHPYDPEAPAIGETDLSWVEEDFNGITGIEIWNGMSEFKSLLKSKLHAIYYAYNPRRVAHAPFPQSLEFWDKFLSRGYRLVAVGGSDAHEIPAKLGPLRRTLFPYEFHFRSINTHLFVDTAFSGDFQSDRELVLEGLRKGRGFVGYDLPASTKGFRFTAKGTAGTVWMGEDISVKGGVTLQIKLPQRAECQLIHNGKVIQNWENQEICTYITTEPGAYRVEVYIKYLGKRRGWIFSNPIYITK